MRAITRFLSLTCVLFVSHGAFAAEEPSRISIHALVVGSLSRTDVGAGILEVRTRVSPNLLVTLAPALVAVERRDDERQFRASATLLLRVGPVRVEDRNMWVFSDAGTTRYQNRLRLTTPVEVSGHALRLHLLNEAFYQEGGRGWFRNTFGAGVGFDVSRSLTVDTYLMRVDDDHLPHTSMFVLMLTARLL